MHAGLFFSPRHRNEFNWPLLPNHLSCLLFFSHGKNGRSCGGICGDGYLGSRTSGSDTRLCFTSAVSALIHLCEIARETDICSNIAKTAGFPGG